MKLNSRPYNANQLAKCLKLDYKTVKHHLNVLVKKNIVMTCGEGQYGRVYMLSSTMEENFDSFKKIIPGRNLKKNRYYKGEDWRWF